MDLINPPVDGGYFDQSVIQDQRVLFFFACNLIILHFRWTLLSLFIDFTQLLFLAILQQTTVIFCYAYFICFFPNTVNNSASNCSFEYIGNFLIQNMK